MKSKVLSGENVCITNGEEQKARAKGLNRKVDTLKDEFASRCRSDDSALRATLVWEGHPIAEAIRWEMRAVISCLHDQTLGAGQPVAFISTRMAVFLAKRRPRRVLRAARKLRDLLHQGARIHPRVLVDTCCTYCRRTKTDLESTSRA